MRHQRGLALEGKVREWGYNWLNLSWEINMIAYRCGLHHGRKDCRERVSIMQMPGKSIALRIHNSYPAPGT